MAYRKTEREVLRLRQRRDRIVVSACEIVQRSGFGGAKAREIAETAGVSVGSLYSNFDRVEVLHAEAFRLLADRELHRVVEDVHAAPTPTASLAALVRGFGTRSLTAPRLAWALLLEPVTTTVEVLRLEYRSRYVDLATDIMRAGIDTGEFAAQAVDIAAPAVIGAISESLVRPLDPYLGGADVGGGARTHGTELIEKILRLCMRAVGSSAPGRHGHRTPEKEANRSESRRAGGDDQAAHRAAGDTS